MSVTRIARTLPCAIALTLAGGANGCGQSEGQPAPDAREPVHWIVVADLSSSRAKTDLRSAGDLAATLPAVLRSGDKISLLRVYVRGLADSNFYWNWEIPRSLHSGGAALSDSLELEKAAHALHAELTVFLDPHVEGTLKGTDLIATLYRVGDIVRANPGRRTNLVLLSDMLNSTRELDLERGVPDTSWVAQRDARAKLPRLPGVCVVIVGPDVSRAGSRQLVSFWRTFMHATGAEFRDENLVNWMPDFRAAGC